MKRGLGWPIGVAAILAATVGANIWIAVVANDDPSFAIEKDYYRKAVEWDSTLARAQESTRLGWRLAPQLGEMTANGARLRVQLVDSAGVPVQGAQVKVAAFFNARADRVIEATLEPIAGDYEVELPVTHAGQWELRFDVTRGSERFMTTSRIEAVAARGT
jgi:nitrogen fixation protein FixH